MNVPIWISPAELAALPTTGSAWKKVTSYAGQSITMDVISNQDSSTDVRVLAKALVWGRTKNTSMRSACAKAIADLMQRYPVTQSSSSWYRLATVRTLGAWPIIADVIDLKTYDPSLDARFRTWLLAARNKTASGGPDGSGSVVTTQEERPNNFGTHASASRIAIDLYLGDATDLARATQVFKGWLGDRTAYAGFKYGSDLSWHADPAKPVGINPKGATKQGRNIDGVLPDDQRRSGSFSYPFTVKGTYPWEALQGVVAAAEMLHRTGLPAFEWSDRAILRAATWLTVTNANPAIGDDTWITYVINRRYGTKFAEGAPNSPGKMLGFAEWTHRRP